MRLNGQTDVTKLIVAFRDFTKAHKNTEGQKAPVAGAMRRCEHCFQKSVAKYSSIKHKFPYFNVIPAATLNSTQIYFVRS
jgi:hypothetical protein